MMSRCRSPSFPSFRYLTDAFKQIVHHLIFNAFLILFIGVANAAALELSAEEQAWLDKHPVIHLGIDPEWAPFEYRDEQGKYSGMASDYIRLLSNRLGVEFRTLEDLTWAEVIDAAQQDQLDLLPAVMKSEKRAEYLNFTTPYLDFPMVIITRADGPFVASLDDLVDQRVAVVRSYVTQDLMEANHPKLELVLVDNIDRGLQEVALGEVTAYVGNLAAISQAIDHLGLTNLKVAAPTPYSFPLSMGVPKNQPHLVTILDKALASIEPEQARAIRGRWMSVQLEQDTDWADLFKTLAPFISTIVATFIIIIIWNRRLQREIADRKHAEASLKASEEQFRKLFQSNSSVMLLITPDTGQIIDANQAAENFYGYSKEQLLRLSVSDINTLPMEAVAKNRKLAALGKHNHFIFQHRLANGETRDVEVYSSPIQSGGQQLLFSIVHDITERKQAEEKLLLAVNVFRYAREGIMITDADNHIVDVNDAFLRITGYSREEVLGQSPRMFNSGRQGEEFYQSLRADLAEHGHWHGEIWNQRKNGEHYPEMLTISSVLDEHQHVKHYVYVLSDITEQKAHQDQLEHIAHYDALTNLPNRVLLADRLRHGIAQSKRYQQTLAVAYIDLDGFKAINDTYGHDIGDQLLIKVASRMLETMRESDTMARLGGDEFVAVLNELNNFQDAIPMLSRLLAVAVQPVHIGSHTLQVSASIGVTFYPQPDEADADLLLRQADQAMYQAKLAGKNRYHIFDAEQDRHARGHHESVEHIRRALARQEFVLYYQPKVNMRTGEIVGTEALIRWQHPDLGLLQPIKFLPVIENHPLAIELGESVINAALMQLDQWNGMGLKLSVSVNVSAQQLQQSNFCQRLQQLLHTYSTVDPTQLSLEILETSALEDMEHISEVMHECNALGVRFALDDFGTGYSSLTYLKRLPAAQLKIDKSFIRDMLNDADDLAIVEGVLGLASSFRRQAIAEGVETMEHGAMLLSLGCELAQGYYIAKPMPAEDIPAWVKNWRPEPSWVI